MLGEKLSPVSLLSSIKRLHCLNASICGEKPTTIGEAFAASVDAEHLGHKAPLARHAPDNVIAVKMYLLGPVRFGSDDPCRKILPAIRNEN